MNADQMQNLERRASKRVSVLARHSLKIDENIIQNLPMDMV